MGLEDAQQTRETAPPRGAGSPAPFGVQSVCFSFEAVAKLQKLWRFYIETQISVSSYATGRSGNAGPQSAREQLGDWQERLPSHEAASPLCHGFVPSPPPSVASPV